MEFIEIYSNSIPGVPRTSKTSKIIKIVSWDLEKLKKIQNFHFLAMSKDKMRHILPKRKTGVTNFFEYSIISDKLPEN